MTIPNVEEIEEARGWGRSLIVNGLLIIILVLFSYLELTVALVILSVGIVMIGGGFCLCRYSDDALDQISATKKSE